QETKSFHHVHTSRGKKKKHWPRSPSDQIRHKRQKCRTEVSSHAPFSSAC
ncbi:hypothetical protein NDU88_002985, partial [Pleurodeles waltl]